VRLRGVEPRQMAAPSGRPWQLALRWRSRQVAVCAEGTRPIVRCCGDVNVNDVTLFWIVTDNQTPLGNRRQISPRNTGAVSPVLMYLLLGVGVE
jgi:hypothetical protein